jgi:hypothetical protein
MALLALIPVLLASLSSTSNTADAQAPSKMSLLISLLMTILHYFAIFPIKSGQPRPADSDQTAAKEKSDLFWTHDNPGRWTLNESDPSGIYLSTDCDFLTVKFFHDPELGDVLNAQSRADIMMNDVTVPRVLDDVGIVLDHCHPKHTHFASLYDIRTYILPGPSKSYARAKQLIKWMDGYAEKIEAHIHSVAVVIPSGFSAMLLKNVVNFIILVCQPTMGPRVFQGENGYADAVEFLKQRKKLYDQGKINAKPTIVGQRYTDPPPKGKVEQIGCTCHGTWKKGGKSGE